MNLTRATLRFMVALALLGAGLWALLFTEKITDAHPPAPPQYTVTVSKQGGDTCCMVRICSPDLTDWTSGSVQRTYASGTMVGVEAKREYPCPYDFDGWSSNDPELDRTPHTTGWFTINTDTQAKAVFDPIYLPDQESTTWKSHWTASGAPHIGDVYDHTASLSSEPTRIFEGMTINEDFLTSEMTTSGWTLLEEDKATFQKKRDGDWEITATNERDKADAHGFVPTLPPWNAMPDGATLQIIQRMRVKSPCLSEDLTGPWFESHVILFKLIVNPQTGAREVFVKKSGVQGPGDPPI